MTDPIDLAMLARIDELIAEATTAFDAFDYARALERTESVFWWFCDDYVELVKSRAYGARGEAAAASALAALGAALSTFQRLFAPLLPFVTEEVWSWWQPGSVHRAAWPTISGATGEQRALDAVCEVLGQVRRTKTEAKVSQRAAVAVARITARQGVLDLLALGENDLIDAGSIMSLTMQPDDGPAIDVAVELAPAGTEFERDRRS